VRKFDDILRDKLYEATNDNYSDAVWTNIKGQIPVKKKSKSHFLWLASFLFVFAMMITAVQQYPNWKIDQEQNKTAEAEKNAMRYSSIDATTIKGSDQLSLPKKSSTVYKLPSGNNQTASADLSKRSDLIYEDGLLDRQEVKEKINTGIATQNAIPFSFKEDAVSREAVIQNPPYNTSNASSSYEAITFSTNTFKEISPLPELNNISDLSFQIDVPSIKPIKSSRRSKGNEVHCEVLQGKQSKFYVSARHISSYAFNDLTAKTPEADEYMTSRHITESKRYSFSDEVNFGIEYRSGFFAELGIRYDQINEKFNFLDPNAYQTSTVITVDTILIADEPQVLIDTVTTVLAGEREILSNNNFRKLSVPFSVGYQFPLNKKVSLAAKAGLIVNVMSQYNGRMFDEELNVTSIEERQASNNPLFNKLVHSVSGSAFLQYQMNKNMEFLVGVNAYKNLGATSFETNPLNQRYSSLGIFVGGKYNL